MSFIATSKELIFAEPLFYIDLRKNIPQAVQTNSPETNNKKNLLNTKSRNKFGRVDAEKK